MTESPFEPSSGQQPAAPFQPPYPAAAPSEAAPMDPGIQGIQARPANPAQSQYAPWYGQQPGPETPGTPSGGRSRAPLAVGGALALLAAFGIGLVTGRATAPKAAPAAAIGNTPVATSNSSAVAQSGASVGATGKSGGSTGGRLTSLLIPLPAGGRLLPVSNAAPDGSMTLDQFLKELYPSSPSERTLLQARGFQTAAARCLDTSGGQEDCFYLIQFSAPDGAQSYALGLAQAHQDDPSHASDTKFAVPALTDGAGFENSTLDSYGNTDSDVYGADGEIALIVHSYTPAKLDRAGALALVDQQVARLPS
jgi:hypothetical protein